MVNERIWVINYGQYSELRRSKHRPKTEESSVEIYCGRRWKTKPRAKMMISVVTHIGGTVIGSVRAARLGYMIGPMKYGEVKLVPSELEKKVANLC